MQKLLVDKLGLLLVYVMRLSGVLLVDALLSGEVLLVGCNWLVAANDYEG